MADIFHADDFGISLKQARAIMQCSSACGNTGVLNSTSALVNSPAFAECARLIAPYVAHQGMKIGIHLNIVEGHCCADPATIPLLVDAAGRFRQGFVSMLRLNAGEQRNELRWQIAREYRAQIEVFLEAFPDQYSCLRIDSHQHFHLIPAAFAALFDAVFVCGCTIGHLRIPVESLRPYLTTPSVWPCLSPVNLVKAGVLAALWRIDCTLLSAELSRVPRPALFCGVVLSGRMHRIANPRLLAKMRACADGCGCDLELLFHPGSVKNRTESLDPGKAGFAAFYRSANRAAEAQALKDWKDTGNRRRRGAAPVMG